MSAGTPGTGWRPSWKSAALALGLLLVVFGPRTPRVDAGADRGLAQRLLGPIASLAASAQWVRTDMAFRAGRTELALARAERALALDPGSPDGWIFLAWKQAFDLASPVRQPDPVLRLAWLESGLATAARGEARSRDPAELALLAGMILVKAASLDPELPWPGGSAALWAGAAEHFERAGRLGHPWAADMRAAALAATRGD